MSSKRLVPLIVAASVLIGSGSPAIGVSQAEQAILIPGAMPFKKINPLYPTVAETYPDIGKFFHTSDAGRLIEYSQDPLAADTSLAQGVDETIEALDDSTGGVVVIGESMGSMVAWRVAEELAKTDPEGKKPVRFVLIASPDVGISEYFKEGTHIPILNYTIRRVGDSPYDTTIVVGEYDGWSDPPDRPWNLVASANALAGIAYVHGPPSFTADVSDLTPQSVVPRTDQHGSVTTYLLPAQTLPLTQVFHDVGVPDALVDKADEVLRPVVDAGYVRHDKPGDTRPYLYDGEIRRNVQSQQTVRESARNTAGDKPGVGAERRERGGDARPASHSLRDRVEAGFDALKQRIAERKAERESRSTPSEAVTP